MKRCIRQLRIMGIVALILGSAGAIPALAQLPFPERQELNDAAAGRAIVDELLAQRPVQESEFQGVLRTRDGAAGRFQVDVQYRIVPGDEETWRGIYEAGPFADGSMERLVIAHRPGEGSRYFLAHSSGRDEWSEMRELSGDEIYRPFAGSNFWIADLGLEFYNWPEQVLIRNQMRRGRSCRIVESRNPNPGSGQYARVRSWIDVETGWPIIAEAFDERNRLLKVYSVGRVGRVNGVHQVKELEIRDERRDSRTHLEFDFTVE